MNKLEFIRNESGFGLIHVLAVTLIVSIALLGLFMTIEFARVQADKNYHTRSALLLAQGYLEEIKYNNRNGGIYARPSVRTETESVTLDNGYDRSTDATVTVSSTTSGNAEAEPGLLSTFRDVVTVEVTWKENRTIGTLSNQNPTCSIVLQEDYYWKRSGVDVQ